jgi:Domain of unknown function (DUF6484)
MSKQREASPSVTAIADIAAVGAVPVVASLVGVAPDGTVRVELPGHGEAVARLLSSVSRAELRSASPGRGVLVLCEKGDPSRPIVVGLLEAPVEDLMAAEGEPRDKVFSAEGSITLMCGEASLTLHADGRVVTRGVNVVSVASEQQRIQGAVVRIN